MAPSLSVNAASNPRDREASGRSVGPTFPRAWAQRAEHRDQPLVRVYARLSEGAPEPSGRAALTSIAAGLDEAYPRASGSDRSLHLGAPTWIDPRTRLADGDQDFEIVGLVADTKTEDFLARPIPTVYFSFPQRGYGTTSALMISVQGEPAA